MQTISKTTFSILTIMALISPVSAESLAGNTEDKAVNQEEKEVQDMSDPLAVYTQGGIGFTNKGINVKIGQSYDTGDPKTMAMNILEVKGIAGDVLGWDNDSVTSNSVDSMRLRNLSVNLENGRGTQIDINYNLNAEYGMLSYSVIQALPKFGRLNLYPLAGAGAAIGNNLNEKDPEASSGFSVPGILGVVGMYSKFEVTDKIWVNYNPVWLVAVAGSDWFMDYGMGGDDSIFAHELAASYQINPRSNIRYFANWSNNVDFSDGDHRIEYNYQF